MPHGHTSGSEDVRGHRVREGLDFYARPGTMTFIGANTAKPDELPDQLGALAKMVQGLLLHEHWAAAYGIALPDKRRAESHIRPVSTMLDRVLARDDRSLDVARTPDERLVCICRHFALLFVALLRLKGVPARARCGFGAYFRPGHFEDHWVCEYWSESEARWVLVDAQIDEVQRAKLNPDFDLLDVPRDRFLVAGEAWARCRAGAADAETFDIFDKRGLWFIGQNLVRDVAALNKVEMLPWDIWGFMTRPGEPHGDDRLALLDRLAALTRSPDSDFAELRQLYEGDNRLAVPTTVYNALLQRQDAI